MKIFWASTGLILTFCALACAQDTTGNRVVVPARNTSHPRVVNCNVGNGSITVKTHSGADVIVEEPSSGPSSSRGAPAGMHRLNAPMRGLEVVEEDNVITVHNRFNSSGNLIISVPADTSLHLRGLHGAINVDGVHGEVSAHSLNGQITLNHISGTVTADSLNGPIKVTMDQVNPSQPLSFSTLNGSIDVTFPPDLKANLNIKTNRGPVYSDFEVTLGPNRSAAQKNSSPDGKFVIRIDHNISGTINGGGAEMTFRTLNGGVYLRKQK